MDHKDSKSLQTGETPVLPAKGLYTERNEVKGKMADKKKYYRKNTGLFLLVDRIKLWPSGRGLLHGVKSAELAGKYITITTHCGKVFRVYDSRTSRAARWLRNKWASKPCPDCRVPEWKLEKYSKTFFSQYGSDLGKH